MTKVIAQTYDSIYGNIKIINYIFLVGCLVFICFYAISVFSTISRTVALQKIESEITILSGNVNNLDSEYLSLTGKIIPDDLSSFGMKKGQVSQYIARSTNPKFGVGKNYNHVALNGR